MAQLKEIRSRIISIRNTRQVTSAMKMVSAAKLKKAQDIIIQMSIFDQKSYEILQHLIAGGSVHFNQYTEQRPIEEVLIVVVGSNRGLCGGFNSNVAKKAIQHTLENYPHLIDTGKVSFIAIGKQVEKELLGRGAEIFKSAHQLPDHPRLDNSARLAVLLTKWYLENRFQRIELVYNKFKNAAVQLLTVESLLPLSLPSRFDEDLTVPYYLFEPSEEAVIKEILLKALKLHFFRIMLDSNAAENGARMTAMYQATENATEMLKELKNKYNNARQSAITNEIMEIIGGAEALKNR
jgi:F-type H+-transporting ATPase subunit gamma